MDFETKVQVLDKSSGVPLFDVARHREGTT
jgi:hypothetical protein